MAFEFNDPLLYELRAGTSDSSYVDKTDLRPIINNEIILDELASNFYGVVIKLTGTAQAGSSDTITLTSSASIADDRYNSFTISITGGTGSGQSKVISDYNGTTKIATVSSAWTINPDSTSIYAIECYNESKIITSLSINSFYVNYLNSIVTFNSSENGNIVNASYKGRGAILTPANRVYTQLDGNNNVTQTLQDVADGILPIMESEATRVSNEDIRIDNEATRVLGYQDMINTSKMILKNPVATYNDIVITYPSPVIYWTVRTIDDGKLYRYDGDSWEWIDTLNTNVYDTLVKKLTVSSIEPLSPNLNDVWIDLGV